MVRIFCMLLAVLALSACGGGEVPAGPGSVPPQEVIAEPEPDSTGQDEVPAVENAPLPEQAESEESGQQAERPAAPADPSPETSSGTEQPEPVPPEKPEAESAGQGTMVPPAEMPSAATETEPAAPDQEESVLKITVGDQELLATFADNSSAEEFRELLAQGPLTVEMEDYGGFEKVGPLGTTLTRNDTQITTEPGDVILYQGNQITIYYGTNSWSFTRLARIDDPAGLQEKLGSGTVSITFSLA